MMEKRLMSELGSIYTSFGVGLEWFFRILSIEFLE